MRAGPSAASTLPCFAPRLQIERRERYASSRRPRSLSIQAITSICYRDGSLVLIRGVSMKLHYFVLTVVLLAAAAYADEGMWTFDNPPTQLIEQKYHFTLTKQWLDHMRLSSVRLNDGGSGSFVSPHGLLVTNHPVARVQPHTDSTAHI